MRYAAPATKKDKKDIAVRFGAKVKNLRQAHEYTQAQMAEKFGVDRSYISDLERGRKSISLALIEVMALGFEISLSQLFEGL